MGVCNRLALRYNQQTHQELPHLEHLQQKKHQLATTPASDIPLTRNPIVYR